MKTLFYTLSALLFVAVCPAVAQNKILLVNDNDAIAYNTDTLVNDLEDAGFAFDQYSIPLTATNPDSATLAGYDLVIWYASTDGGGLGFWADGMLTANDALYTYVQSGKKLWVVGSDLLYNLYGSAPDLFVANEFAYDCMGLSYYGSQSYGDDGSMGCPLLYAAAGQSGHFADSLTWIFPTAWWIDGVTPREGAETIYVMGPASYSLHDSPSMLYFATDSTQVMSTFFDPALISTYEARKQFLQQSIDFLMDKPVTSIAPATAATVSAAYDAASGCLTIRSSAPVSFTLSNMLGQTLTTGTVTGTSARVNMQTMPAGVYLLRTGEGRNQVVKFIKS